MAAPPPTNHPNALILAVFLLLLFPLFPSKSDGELVLEGKFDESMQKRKMVLGSKPPGCVNKCLSCRPCMATLVVPSHQKKGLTSKNNVVKRKTSRGGDGDDDGSYYLLSWKCRCGDKLFQP